LKQDGYIDTTGISSLIIMEGLSKINEHRRHESQPASMFAILPDAGRKFCLKLVQMMVFTLASYNVYNSDKIQELEIIQSR
jgi:hypothetical protein